MKIQLNKFNRFDKILNLQKIYFFCIMATSLNHVGKNTPHGCFHCKFERQTSFLSVHCCQQYTAPCTSRTTTHRKLTRARRSLSLTRAHYTRLIILFDLWIDIIKFKQNANRSRTFSRFDFLFCSWTLTISIPRCTSFASTGPTSCNMSWCEHN